MHDLQTLFYDPGMCTYWKKMLLTCSLLWINNWLEDCVTRKYMKGLRYNMAIVGSEQSSEYFLKAVCLIHGVII